MHCAGPFLFAGKDRAKLPLIPPLPVSRLSKKAPPLRGGDVEGTGMSLLKMLQQAQGGQGLGQLADQLGLDQAQAGGLAEMLAPAIGSAAKSRAQSGGLEGLLGQLKGEGMGKMFDDATQAAAPQGQQAGMDFLENLLGDRGRVDGLAQEAAGRSGIDASTVMKFLPALAAMLQGGMQKQMPDSSIDGMLAAQSGGNGGLGKMLAGVLGGNKSNGADLGALTQMLDADGDGSPLDDVLGKFMS